ncbi:MAG: hypothetical protein ACOX3T_06175 [Bdellovibrionota bacterium]
MCAKVAKVLNDAGFKANMNTNMEAQDQEQAKGYLLGQFLDIIEKYHSSSPIQQFETVKNLCRLFKIYKEHFITRKEATIVCTNRRQ